ncbi:tRNA (adenine(22)-N(1))-methyltransferase TrmK [uncultured Vibrio sp.]|uniref:tRNA (adenine(22)-N(1))-methyltransferase n=1 Tax=uncultured Vibrio sp. TaxID=114054 RepID=UPI0025DCA5E2|nr:tRNA (adenine(22)-N(1))-methyltransferase TrmK [uncultured Vibrio sp.]
MKLGKRLKQIDELVDSSYDHIWDCCCDHGFLGAQLLSRGAGGHIHFVDIVENLMAKVESNLQRFFLDSDTPWSVHCIDVATLPLKQHSGRHLIIIAGVGGDLMIDLINSILDRNPAATIDFLLCPVHHQYNVRYCLNKHDFQLRRETLIEENKRYYEILLVSSELDNRESKPIAATGSDIWKPKTSEQFNVATGYLKKTLAHYYRIAQGAGSDHQAVIDAYERVQIEPIE